MLLWAISVVKGFLLLLEAKQAVAHFGFLLLVMMMQEAEKELVISLSDFDLSMFLNYDFIGTF